jgi:hypothetical protein
VRPAAEALIDALGRSGTIFEYTDYEGRTIEGMIRSCPDLEAPLRAIRERLVDLHPVTQAAYYHRDLRAYCKRDTEGLMRLAGFLQGLG